MKEQEIRQLIRVSPDAGYRALFEEYWSYVYTIVFHVLRGSGSKEDIEDCVIDVLGEVMLRFDTAHEGSLKAYIGTTAKRKAIDAGRALSARNGRTISMDSENFPELPAPERVEEAAEHSELTRILLAQITALGEPDAAILIQKYFYDRNSIEIARILRMNPVTVRSRCHRAMKRLKQALSELGIDKEGLL